MSYAEQLLDKSVDLVDRYVKTKYFPDKALDVVDAAGAAVKLRESDAVTMQDIVKVISKESKIGADVIDIESSNAYTDLDDRIKLTVYGQDEAIDKIVESILVSKSGLREPHKPKGHFNLFVDNSSVNSLDISIERIGYKKEIITIRGNNIYGIRQYPEKLIPRCILSLIKNKKIPIHGNGKNIR